MKIFFTKRAEIDFITIKKFIEIKWGIRVSEAFETKTFDFLDLLEDFPEMGSLEVKEKNIRGF